MNFKYPPIVVDCETTGLELSEGHFAVEVAWWNLVTNERACFIPPHSRGRRDGYRPVPAGSAGMGRATAAGYR